MHRFAAMAIVVVCASSWSQTPLPLKAGIYSCKDDKGHPIKRDRYIPECADREQFLLNPDGSVREVIPPTETSEARAQREDDERRKREAEAAKRDAIKYDINLLNRFPTEASHQRARESALNSTRFSTQSAESRLRELAEERKKLAQEAEFYRGRRLPAALKQQIDGNEVAQAAQRNAIKNAEAERDRINAKFDEELARLRKLWDGARPGSLGPALK
jgi:hypothetical protein